MRRAPAESENSHGNYYTFQLAPVIHFPDCAPNAAVQDYQTFINAPRRRGPVKRSPTKDVLGWGVALWFIGYVLGIILIPAVGPRMVGWTILPIGVALTWWVLARKIRGEHVAQYALVGIVWVGIAIVLDYLFIVKAFHPADGYYKADVYAYYGITAILPLIAAGARREPAARR